MQLEAVKQESLQLSGQERDEIRKIVQEASAPIAPFWPMRTMVAQNPLHGLEGLPFDQAVQKGKHLLNGNGFLPNEEYRQFYREGRISAEHINKALKRVGPSQERKSSIQIGSRQVTPSDVWHLHLLFGFEELEASLLEWEMNGGGGLKKFREDLPVTSRDRIIARTIHECEHCRTHPEEAYLTNVWKSLMAGLRIAASPSVHLTFEDPSPQTTSDIKLPPDRTVSDWVDVLSGSELAQEINNQLIKWVAAFLDEGLAGWSMPQRSEGFYDAWRELVRHEFSATLLGIQNFAKTIDDLPGEPEDAIVWSLRRLEVPLHQWSEYLSRQLSSLPGWTRYIRWLGEHPGYHAQQKHPIDMIQYLAVRLFYEVELVNVRCLEKWGIHGTVSALTGYWNERPDDYRKRMGEKWHFVDPSKRSICKDVWRLFHLAQFLELSPIDIKVLSHSDVRTMLEWLDDFPSERHGPVWLEAYEEFFREDILKKILAHRGNSQIVDSRPSAQLVFCIDVRSESFRRHIEAQGCYETFGFAGFFGIPISHQAFDSDVRSFLCPVLLTPSHAVTETPRREEGPALENYSSRSRWHQLGHHLFHDLKHHPLGSMMVIDVLGFLFSLGLVGKTLLQKPFRAITATIDRWFAPSVGTQMAIESPVDPLNQKIEEVSSEGIPETLSKGFSLVERATFIENGLRGMGLTHNFARFVCLCGHGSETDNNPYYGALDCGACGGAPGDANARVFATMANDPEVRRLLQGKGLSIPDDTWFLPGKHNTTTDRVEFYDVEELPHTHQDGLAALQKDLEAAGAKQALERCHRIPGAPVEISPPQAFAHVRVRSCDWANPRPEWGLAGNGAFLIGRRQLTKGLDLSGRVFLHSYDPIADPQGAILEKIMTAPLIVGEWINTGYYFSAVDPWTYGSGSKVLHNVVGGVGMMLGSQSDLQMGFPLQTVNNGEIHYHEPMRLLAIIEHTPRVISSIIQKHAILQQLFHNQWLNLVAIEPQSFGFHRYNPDGTWELLLQS